MRRYVSEVSPLQLDCICFDIDGTLCDYGVEPRTALERVCRDLGIEAALDPDEYYELYKVVAKERSESGYSEVSDEAYRRLLEREGYGDPQLAERVADGYRRTRLASIELYPETLEVLETLSQRFRLGIISNGPSEIQRAKISKFRLADYFEVIIISGEVGLEKPHEAIFNLALQQIQAEASRSAHVGDDLNHDVKGALGAGLTSFWVNRGVLNFQGVEVAPHYELENLRELLSVLDGYPTPR